MIAVAMSGCNRGYSSEPPTPHDTWDVTCACMGPFPTLSDDDITFPATICAIDDGDIVVGSFGDSGGRVDVLPSVPGVGLSTAGVYVMRQPTIQ